MRPSIRHRNCFAGIVRNPIPAILLAVAAFAQVGWADTPDPLRVTVLPCYGPNCDAVLVAPGPLTGTTYTITIRNWSNQPIVGAYVIAVFHPAIKVCADQSLSGVTDANGTCLITFKAAGCIPTSTPGACTLVANGIEIRGYTKVRSPDNASHHSSVPSGTVTVADLVFFSEEFKGTAPAACHDYTNDGAVNVADLATFGDAFLTGLSCPLSP